MFVNDFNITFMLQLYYIFVTKSTILCIFFCFFQIPAVFDVFYILLILHIKRNIYIYICNNKDEKMHCQTHYIIV